MGCPVGGRGRRGGDAARGRPLRLGRQRANGGFLNASLRHRLENGLSGWRSRSTACFTHRWAGAINTCSRLCVTFRRALGGRAAYAVGYTGLGVGASRFGTRVVLDMVHSRDTELTRLQLVRIRPIPFPPEPPRYATVQATRSALARADERGGLCGPGLQLLDRIGAGFDS